MRPRRKSPLWRFFRDVVTKTLSGSELCAAHILALALRGVRALPAAETSARRALELAPDFRKAHFALGVILALAERGASPDEAVKHFLRAADELPRASLFAVVVLLDQGHVSEAKTHLRNYLGRPQ